jgi:hypothetical protein
MSFDHFATVTASTKRPPAIAGGKRGTPAANLTSLKCTPLDPVDSEIRERFGLNAPMELLQTFVEGGLDIKEGDLLVVSSVEYPIRAVGDWHWPPDTANYLHLILEQLKT